MANVKAAIDFVLREEDARMTGAVTRLSGDSGGATRYGLASRAHPELVASGYFNEQESSNEAALIIAEQVYETSYATPLQIAEIDDQAVATAVLSFGVNSGLRGDVELIQRACTRTGRAVSADGDMGPGTLAAINSINPALLLGAFSSLVDAYYVETVERHPEDAGFLRGWTNRVAEWASSAAEAHTHGLVLRAA
jgi:lysozyme family protein